MKNKNIQKFVITVKTDKKLTRDEIANCLYDFKCRLNGFGTECPEELIDADITLEAIIED